MLSVIMMVFNVFIFVLFKESGNKMTSNGISIIPHISGINALTYYASKFLFSKQTNH